MWFVKLKGQRESGPHDAAYLIDLAASGKLARDDIVRKGESGNWVRADMIKGLVFGSDDDVLSVMAFGESNETPRAKIDKQKFRGSYDFGIVNTSSTALAMTLHVKGTGEAYMFIHMKNDEEREEATIVLGRGEWDKFNAMVDEARGVIQTMIDNKQIENLTFFG